jgi:membrane-associated PAP2 superfamily phosphatase
MDNKRSNIIISALKFLKWSFLFVLIVVNLFTIFYGITMHDMQMDQISKISKYIDTGEINEINHLARKDMILTQGLLFLSFIISICCLIIIIIFLYISLLLSKRKLKMKHSQALAAKVTGHATEAQS